MEEIDYKPSRVIQELMLEPHVEGGYYRQTYVACDRMSSEPTLLDDRFRPVSSAIYFLLTESMVSKIHRIDADEVWHLYDGGPLIIVELDPCLGTERRTKLGRDILKGERPQHVVRKGVWFGAYVESLHGFALVGCTVAPAFRFSGFELGKRDELKKLFPTSSKIIDKLSTIADDDNLSE